MRDADIRPVSLRDVKVTDAFWLREMELVRREVIPYQWEALNDRVPGAVPSWWMHNMRAAARANAARRAGARWQISPEAERMRFQPLPEEGARLNDNDFYGFVFQDTDGYKWIESVSYQLIRCPDPELQAVAQEAVDAICAAQEPDGYLDTYYTLGVRDRAFTNLKDHHELYCLGHLTEAAVAWHQATGRTDLLDAACRFADCVAGVLGREAGKKHGYPGHEIAEMALVRLWEETGEERYLSLARYFIDERGREPAYFALEEQQRLGTASPKPASAYDYYQASRPVREQQEAVGHAVRAMYLYAGMADIARITGDEALKEACRRLWHSAVEEKRYVTGGVGATHLGEAFSRPYDLPSDTAYSETCASVGLAFFARRMLQLEPRSAYGDIMEEALYNTVLAGMALDGKRFFYVNPLSSDPAACRTDGRLAHVKPTRQKWFGCACCPPNIARIVSSLPAYACAQSDDTLYVHLYLAGEMDVRLNGQALRLRMDSGMPWSGEAQLTVLEGTARGTIALRLPGWSRDPKVTPLTAETVLVPSDRPETAEDAKACTEKEGYLFITGEWKRGDCILMDFDMPVRLLRALPQVRELAGQVCVRRGPLTYCAEEADNGGMLHLWRIRTGCEEEIRMETREIGGVPMTVLCVPAVKEQLPPADTPLYSPWTHPEEEEKQLTMIPYFAWDNRGENEMSVWFRTAT